MIDGNLGLTRRRPAYAVHLSRAMIVELGGIADTSSDLAVCIIRIVSVINMYNRTQISILY